MAGRGIDIGPDDFVNLSANADLDLDAGTKYTIRNKSDYRLWLLEHQGAGVPQKDSAETLRQRDFVEPWKPAIVSYASNSVLYAWYTNKYGGTISMVEV